MSQFKVTPSPAEAQALQGQNQARVMYSIGVGDLETGGGGSVPVCLNVVLDQSGSMQGGKIAAAKEALETLLEQVPNVDNVVVSIVLFSDDANVHMEPKTGRQIRREIDQLRRSIRHIDAYGQTSLGSGIRLALQVSSAYTAYDRRILMITDGKQEGATPIHDAYSAASQANSMGYRVDAWGVGDGWAADQLRTIAHTTGGEADVVPDARELAGAISDLFGDVQNTRASDVRLILNTPVGTRITSVRQVFPSVQDRAAQQQTEQRWIIPIGSLGREEPKFVIELETTPRNNNIPFRILVPTVLYRVGGNELVDELDRSAWFFVRWVGTPGEVKMDPELTRYTGEEEIASLSQEGFSLLEMGAVPEATAKLTEALQRAIEINSPQAVVLSTVVNPRTGKLVSSDVNSAVNKTGKLHSGKTGKIMSSTGKLPAPGSGQQGSR